MIMDGSLKFENLNILSHPVDQSLVLITKHKMMIFSMSMNYIWWGWQLTKKNLLFFLWNIIFFKFA